MSASWYDVLDVDPEATADEIRAAWRAAVADLDPTDRRFRVYNEAAEVLLDPQRRSAYDAEVERGRSDEAKPERGRSDEAERGRCDEAKPRRNDRSEPEASLLARDHSWPAWPVPGWLLTTVAGLTALAVACVLVLLSRPTSAAVEGDGQAAQAAAERAIVPLLSYDAHDLDRSRAQATPYMTDSERQQYDKLFAVIQENAPRTGTVVRAKYLSSGIVRTGTDRVDVLVFVNQATTNKQHPTTPVVYKNQVTVTMAKVGNDWLVDNLSTSADTP
jgi:Mce-associated membrane protein